MWIFTPVGFFSAVRKPGESLITVRARVRRDLDDLRDGYLPTLTKTVAGKGTDYPYRATATRRAWADAVARMAMDVTYGNFKAEVARVQGSSREAAYHRVWAVLLDLDGADGAAAGVSRRAAGPRQTKGGAL